MRKHFPYSWNKNDEKKRPIVKNIPGNRLLKIPEKGNQRVRGLGLVHDFPVKIKRGRWKQNY